MTLVTATPPAKLGIDLDQSHEFNRKLAHGRGHQARWVRVSFNYCISFISAADPPLRLGQVRYDTQGVLRYPRHHDREPESELQRYLEEAKAVLAAATPPSGEPVDDLVSADFEQCAGSTCTPSAVARTAG